MINSLKGLVPQIATTPSSDGDHDDDQEDQDHPWAIFLFSYRRFFGFGWEKKITFYSGVGVSKYRQYQADIADNRYSQNFHIADR